MVVSYLQKYTLILPILLNFIRKSYGGVHHLIESLQIRVNMKNKQGRIWRLFVYHVLSFSLREKVSKYGVFSGLHFPAFGLNTESSYIL